MEKLCGKRWSVGQKFFEYSKSIQLLWWGWWCVCVYSRVTLIRSFSWSWLSRISIGSNATSCFQFGSDKENGYRQTTRMRCSIQILIKSSVINFISNDRTTITCKKIELQQPTPSLFPQRMRKYENNPESECNKKIKWKKKGVQISKQRKNGSIFIWMGYLKQYQHFSRPRPASIQY